MSRIVRWGLSTLVVLWAVSSTFWADVAYLRNGRTIDVSSFKVHGESILLSIEGGGEMALPVREVLEIRRQPPEARTAVATAPLAAAPTLTALEESSAPTPRADAPAPDAGAAQGAGADGRALAEGVPALPVGGVFDRAALKDMAARIARRHGVDESLVHAVIQVESRYDAFAVSPRGAMGLMQLMPKTADRFDVDNAFDPVENVDAGVRYLKELLERYSGQPRLALAAYNAGEEAVERYSGIPPYRETIDYIRKVLGIARR